MNKTELITTMAEKSQLSKKDTELALKSFIETVEETLEKVALSDSLNNLKEDDKTKQQEAISNDLQILKDKGLAAYLRSRKDK